MIMRTLFILFSALVAVACTNFEKLPSSQTVTYYDAVVVTDAEGNVVRDAAGNPVVDLSNPREMTERALMLMVQQKTIEGCAATKGKELELLGDAIKGANSATGQQEWAEYMKQRDLITALKPDFDSSGCTALVSAQGSYWETVQSELRFMAQNQRLQYGLLSKALQVAGIVIVADQIGDTLVGLAQAGGQTYIGNSIAGAGGSAGGGGSGVAGEIAGVPGGPGGGAAGGNAGDIDFGNSVIQLPSNGSLAGAGNAVLVGREGNFQQTDGGSSGQQGQVLTDPNSVTQPQAGDGAAENAPGGSVDFGPDQGQSIDGI